MNKQETINKIEEQHKPLIPQYIAEWINFCKKHEYVLAAALYNLNEFDDEFAEAYSWIKNKENQEVFARAWLDGYSVGQEYVVTDGSKLYFKGFGDVDVIIVIDNMPGAISHAKRYINKDDAQKTADMLGWEVREVE